MEHLWPILPPFVVLVGLLFYRKTLLSLILGVASCVILLSLQKDPNFLFWTWKLLSAKFLSDFNLKILLFLYLLLTFTSLLASTQAITPLVEQKVKGLKDPKKMQFSVYVFGWFMFFDGVGSAAVISGVFSNLARKVKVSAEKLAYIADTTAAPIAALIPVSTWIAFEISMFQEIIENLHLKESPYTYFFESVPFRFYSLFSLIHLPILIWIGKDWGPMKKAELKCVQQIEEVATISPMKKVSICDYWPVLPIILLCFGMLLGTAISGNYFKHFNVQEALTQADTAFVLVILSFLCCVISLIAAKFHHRQSRRQIVTHVWKTWKGVTQGVLILFFAWGLSSGMKELGTAKTLLHLMSPFLEPAILSIGIFLSGCVISFLSGTAWGTISILFPIAVPIAYHIGGTPLMIISMGAVLEGAIFGNHTSPFSETTIISSMASGCTVEAHVKTQLPYAIFVAFISLFVGYLPSSLGCPIFISFSVATLLMFFFYRFFLK